MTKPLRLDAEAEEELRAAADWYEAQKLGLGKDFLDAIDDALDRLRKSPGAASLVASVPASWNVRRVLVHRFPYAIVFVELEREVRVLAAAHGKRRPGYWRDRLGKRS